MSNYQEETGKLLFTKTGYPQITRLVREEFNAYQDLLLEAALDAHQKLLTIKGRNRALRQYEYLNSDIATSLIGDRFLAGRFGQKPTLIDWDNIDALRMSMFVFDTSGTPVKLRKPLKKDFKKLTNRDKSFEFKCGEAAVRFSEKSLSMEWVADGNRSVDNARNSFMYHSLIRAFNKYKWKSCEGGVFYYIDEYMRDGAMENHYAASAVISEVFGPAGKKINEAGRGF